MPSQRPIMRNALSLAIVVAGLGAAVAVYFQLFGTPFIRTLSELTADSSAFTLNLLGAGVEANGSIVSSDRFAYNVVAECTAIGPLVIYMAAVLVFSAPLRAKLIGALLGVGFIGGLNVVRLVSLFYIGTYLPAQMDLFHLLIWQGVMVLSVVMLWLYWVRRWAHAPAA